jgi:hypothetical protein
MHTALVFWSQIEGVGKNLLVETVAMMVGVNHSVTISQGEVDAQFNAWMLNRVFVIADEVLSSDRRRDADKIKGWITTSTIHVNQKNVPVRSVANFMNFIFLSNHCDAVFFNQHDRRFFVWEITAPMMNKAEVDRFTSWRTATGLAALRHLLNNVDLTRFDPTTPAPATAAKAEMIEDNRSDLERYLADVMGSNVTAVMGRDLFTASELAMRYHYDLGGKGVPPSSKAVTSACKKLGACARQITLPSGKKRRVLAIANPGTWTARPNGDWAQEYAKPPKT